MIRDVFEAFEHIENTGGRNAKLNILSNIANHPGGDHILRRIFKYTFDGFLVYNLHMPKSPEFGKGDPEQDTDERFFEFIEILDSLASSDIPVSNARQRLTEMFTATSPLFVKWCNRIMNRDLRCGIAGVTAVKMYPKLWVRWGIQLCQNYGWQEFDGFRYVEPKFDGIRALAIVDKPNVKFLSRNSKPIWNTDLIEREILEYAPDRCVLDGEMYAGDKDSTHSIVSTHDTHEKQAELKFHIFDILSVDEFTSLRCDFTLRERKQQLTDSVGFGDYMKLVTPYIAETPAEIESITKEFIDEGFEGSVIKDPSAMYSYSRDGSWLRVKPFKSSEFVVVDVIEGNGRLEGTLGALVVVDKEGKVKTRVGTILGGDKVRKMLWDKYHDGELLGMQVEVEYQEGTVYDALRHSKFRHLREDLPRLDLVNESVEVG